MKTSIWLARARFVILAATLAVAQACRAQDNRLGHSQERPVADAGIGYLRETKGDIEAVVVGAARLVYTKQMLPARNRGALADEVTGVLAQLKREAPDGGWVKLNVYVAMANDVREVRKIVAEQFAGKTAPVMSYVVTALPGKCRIGMDAVFARSGPPPKIARRTERGIASSATLPSTPIVFLSGMADTNALPEAAHKTLEKLVAALAQIKVPRQNIVQLKAFLQPMADVEKVENEIARFFDGKAPPIVFVEWISPAPNPPIEIELVAAAEGDFSHEHDPVTFLTPPGTTSTKVFSRVVRVNHGKLIFMNEFVGKAEENAENQVTSIFKQLEFTAKLADTDFLHLVKATYYVSDDAASGKLNDLRPLYFDPKRPPAASKAKVAAIGAPDRTVSIDMIAVKGE
jgi:enamine deaminase RidA (YjgF/YER057c/UK114 family)